MRIAVLGWGSLLWETDTDRGRAFQEHLHGDWRDEGPILQLEFSRISKSRGDALTLVLDDENGVRCKVAYAFSTRRVLEDAICDLRCREGTNLKKIGSYWSKSGQEEWGNSYSDDVKASVKASVRQWARDENIDAVVWTALESNFTERKDEKFSVDAAKRHVQSLNAENKVKAAEYIWRAPELADTPVRRALQSEPWFRNSGQLESLGVD